MGLEERRKLRLPGRQILPDPRRMRWPEGKNLAVCFTADCYGSEAASLHHMLASTMDFGPNRGAVDLAALLAHEGVKATFNIAGATARARKHVGRELASAGHEIAVCGDKYQPHFSLTRDQERDTILRAKEAVAKSIGREPDGWRTPQSRPTVDTLPLLVQAGFRWDSSLRNDEVPYTFAFPHGDIVEVPAGGPSDDSGYVGFPAPITPPHLVMSVWRDEFEMLYADSLKRPAMMVLSLSPSFMGRRAGLSILRELIGTMKARSGVWFATCGEVAEWWRSNQHRMEMAREPDPA
jgi:peptidoglycan-N-acetylglucosamine deacetylase